MLDELFFAKKGSQSQLENSNLGENDGGAALHHLVVVLVVCVVCISMLLYRAVCHSEKRGVCENIYVTAVHVPPPQGEARAGTPRASGRRGHGELARRGASVQGVRAPF